MLNMFIKGWLEKYDSDELIRHSVLVAFFTHFGSFTNLAFHMVMGRLLSPGEYAVLASLVGVFLVWATPTVAIQQTLAHFAGYLDQMRRRGDIKRLRDYWLFRLGILLGPLCICALLGSSFFARLLHLPPNAFFEVPLGVRGWSMEISPPVVLVGFMVVGVYLQAVFVGCFQGLQWFFWMSVVGNAWSFVRIALGTVLVLWLGDFAAFGLFGHLSGLVLGLGLSVLVFRRRMPRDVTLEPIDRSDGYMLRSVASLFCFSILMSGDIVLAKLLFPAEIDYAPYARASTIARTLIFLCQPIAGALFPKVISKGQSSAGHRATLLKAAALAGLTVGFMVFLCVLFPRFPLWVLYGERDACAQLVGLVRRVSVAMAPLGVTFILMNYEAAQHRFGFLLPLFFCAAGFVLFAFMLSTTLERFALVYFVANLAALAVFLSRISGARCPTEPEN